MTWVPKQRGLIPHHTLGPPLPSPRGPQMPPGGALEVPFAWMRLPQGGCGSPAPTRQQERENTFAHQPHWRENNILSKPSNRVALQKQPVILKTFKLSTYPKIQQHAPLGPYVRSVLFPHSVPVEPAVSFYFWSSFWNCVTWWLFTGCQWPIEKQRRRFWVETHGRLAVGAFNRALSSLVCWFGQSVSKISVMHPTRCERHHKRHFFIR